jgi:hypothetical protein
MIRPMSPHRQSVSSFSVTMRHIIAIPSPASFADCDRSFFGIDAVGDDVAGTEKPRTRHIRAPIEFAFTRKSRNI